MFLSGVWSPARLICFPRASGDVPGMVPFDYQGKTFSPRERGCSVEEKSMMVILRVFPARAGMFL